MNILEILAQKKIISAKDIASIKEEMESSGMSVEEVLVKRGIDPNIVTKNRGEYLKIPTRALDNQDVPFSVLQYIPEESAMHYKFVPLAVKDNVLEVGLVDPDNIEARDALNFISSKSGLPFKIFLI